MRAIILSALMLGGCVSNAEMQTSEVRRSFTSSQEPGLVADCIYSAALGIAEGLTLRKTNLDNTIHITADAGDARSLSVYDVAISSTPGGSLIELRSHGNVWGSSNEPKELPTIIENCATPRG